MKYEVKFNVHFIEFSALVISISCMCQVSNPKFCVSDFKFPQESVFKVAEKREKHFTSLQLKFI